MLRRYTYLIAVLFSSLVLAACQTVDKPASPCADQQLSSACILSLADAALASTDDDFEFVSAAAELALAYDSSGESAQAGKLIEQALSRSGSVQDAKWHSRALAEIATVIAQLNQQPQAQQWLAQLERDSLAAGISTAKIMVAEAVHGNAQQALNSAIALPQATDRQASDKAVAIRKISTILAKDGDLEGARQAVAAITMSISYFQAMVRSDIARLAFEVGNTQLAESLLVEAEKIAIAQENGYFSGAIMRDIAYSFSFIGEPDKALRYFQKAAAKAGTAKLANDRARATSRIATRIADAAFGNASQPVHPDAQALLDTAVEHAQDIESPLRLGHAYYEITGSAAFVGEFELANSLLEKTPHLAMGSTASLKSAAQRDLAWGLARHGKLAEGVSVASNITAMREKVHALSRIVRVLNNPAMNALPRYL